jgi:ferric-dicitrate binding protein FerR (iron transport regulator)
MKDESRDLERWIADALEDCRDGALDDERLQAVRELLLTSSTARKLYLKHNHFSRMLAAEPLPPLASKEAVGAAKDVGSSEIAPARTTATVAASAYQEASGQSKPTSLRSDIGWQSARGLAGWIAAGIALIVLAGVVFQRNAPRDTDASSVPVADGGQEEAGDLGVAVLTRVSGLQGEHTADWVTGKTIPPGTLQWDAGLLQLEFYCGATVVAEGPASLEILDDSRVVCRSGRLRACAPPPARGFTVLAPTVELVDLGTEFGIRVEANGATEIHVFDGAVELYDPESDRNVTTRRELNAGDAVTLDRNGETKKIETRDLDFVTPNRFWLSKYFSMAVI